MLLKIHRLLLALFLMTTLAACKTIDPIGSLMTQAQPLAAEAAQPALAASLPSDAEACINNTGSEADCKDCCDNLSAGAAGRKACRDVCPQHDFSLNTNLITVTAVSLLGPDGDYSACTASGSQQPCKTCCDSSSAFQNGDRRFCRDACNKLQNDEKAGAQATPQAPAGERQPPAEAKERQGGGGTPPAEAIAACTDKSEQAACQFTWEKGSETGVCELVQNQMACSPKHEGAQDQPAGQQGQAGQQPGGGQQYNIEQAISDKAQGMTIAFDGLAFLTGDLGSDSFFPPGKVADFWGFQYLRDNDQSEMGHAGDFLTSASMNMLNILSPAQRAELVTLAHSQVDDINQYGYNRFVLMLAFRRLIENDLPSGATGLDEDAIKAYSASLYRLDGEISFARAQVMGKLLNQLDATQKAALDGMVGKGMQAWPSVSEPDDVRGLDRDVKVAVMTYAGDMFSWYAGSVEADVYFCPERHGTYFGSFYLKDRPAMDDSSYAIPTNMTGDMGDTFLQTLTEDQTQQVTSLVDIQKPYLQQIVEIRRQVSNELRKFLAGGSADQAQVLGMMEQYGALDGEIIYNLATHFVAVSQSLSAGQKDQLMALRKQMLGAQMYPSGAYLYSQPIDMPEIPNTDFLFK